MWIAAAGCLIWGIGAAAQTSSGGGPLALPSFITGSTPPQTPQAPPPWSGTDGASGHPLMTAEAIRAAAANFDHCLAGYVADAARRGISAATSSASRGLTPDLRIMDLLDAQPEFTKSVWDYLDMLVTDARMRAAAKFLRRTRRPSPPSKRTMASTATSSPRSGASSRITGTRAATAAWCARPRRSPASGGGRNISRTSFSRRWRSCNHGDLKPEQSRLMGRRVRPDAIHADRVQALCGRFRSATASATSSSDVRDMIASTANKLKKDGWTHGRPGATKSRCRKASTIIYADRAQDDTVAQWQQLGIRRAGGSRFRATPTGLSAGAGGAQGPGFLMLQISASSCATIRRKPMRSPSATSPIVCAAAQPFVQAWPRDERVLTRDERLELQQLLGPARLL